MHAVSKFAAASALALSTMLATHAGTAIAQAAATVDSAALAEGEIRKIDLDTGKVTLRHGELKNLDMPPMTMVFRVRDPAALGQFKAGDKVRFLAEKVNGQFTVIHMEIGR